MPCKIVIPSHKRHDRVFAKKLVNDPIICVAESQADLYQQFNPECEIVTHPDDVMGLIPKRNWMAKHFGELFMLDDDVHACKPIYVEKGEPSRIKDKDKITNIIQSLFEMASMMDVHLFGFTARISPVMYDESAFLSLGEPIKVGHHSEKRHRKAIDDAWNNMGKSVEFSDKAAEHERVAKYWEKRANTINLSMPESIDFYEHKLEQAKEYHEGLKSGKYRREHTYAMAYANKAVKEAKKNYDLAVKLWGDV